MTLESPMTDPTERSMPPAVMTKVMPIAMTPRIDPKRMIVTKLSKFMNVLAGGDPADDDDQQQGDDEAEVAPRGSAQEPAEDVRLGRPSVGRAVGEVEVCSLTRPFLS